MKQSSEKVRVERVTYMLMVQKMPRAIAFYRDAIGLDVRLESPHWSELTLGDAIVALHGGGKGHHVKTGLSFQVGDLATGCEAVAAAGGTIVQVPESRPGEPIKLARLRDPEGNEFTMTQYLGA